MSDGPVVPSLSLEVEKVDGLWIVAAPWLDVPLSGEDFFEVYWLAMRAKGQER